MTVKECQAMIEKKVWVKHVLTAGGGISEVTIDGVLLHHDVHHREMVSAVVRDRTGTVYNVLPAMLSVEKPEPKISPEEEGAA